MSFLSHHVLALLILYSRLTCIFFFKKCAPSQPNVGPRQPWGVLCGTENLLVEAGGSSWLADRVGPFHLRAQALLRRIRVMEPWILCLQLRPRDQAVASCLRLPDEAPAGTLGDSVSSVPGSREPRPRHLWLWPPQGRAAQCPSAWMGQCPPTPPCKHSEIIGPTAFRMGLRAHVLGQEPEVSSCCAWRGAGGASPQPSRGAHPCSRTPSSSNTASQQPPRERGAY